MEKAKRGLFFVPGLVCLLLGCVFLLVHRYSKIKHEASENSLTGRTWAKLEDIGERIKRDYENRMRKVYYGVYEYNTADGQHISSASEFDYSNQEAIPGADGKMVNVRYNLNNPTEFALEEEQAVLASVWPKLRKTGIWLLVLGILLIASAAAGMLGFFDQLIEKLMS